MASWIKMRTNLYDDPRVRQIAKEIKCHVVSVIGCLYVLWSLADEHTVDGFLPTYDAAEVDRRVGRAGFAAALTKLAPNPWIEITDAGVRILNFEDHNGETAKKRAQVAKRVQKHRERYTAVTQEALPEKSREEKKIKSAAHSPRDKPGMSVGSDGVEAVDQTPPPAVEAIYRAYPRHEEPKAAKEAIRRALASLRKRSGMTAPEAWLLERTQAYAKARQAAINTDPQEAKYTPYPQRWFGKARYDEPEETWLFTKNLNGKGHDVSSKQQRAAVARSKLASPLPITGRVLGVDDPYEKTDGDGSGADPFPDATNAD